MKLKTRLTLTFVLIAVVLLGAVSVVTNLLFDRVFQNYVVQAREQKSAGILQQLEESYRPAQQGWNAETLESIGVAAMGSSLIVTVRTVEDAELWDAWKHNNGMCTTILEEMARNVYSRYPNFKGEYMQDRHAILVDGAQVGWLDIGYYGPFYFTDNDLTFLRTFNWMLAGVAVIGLVLAVFIGLLTSQGLSRPITSAVHMVNRIAGGDLTQRLQIKSKTAELTELSQSVNHLMQSLDTLEQLRRRMASDVAHELRTPLFTLQSHVEAMLDGVWALDASRLRVCHEEILRLNDLVGDLQRLSQMEAEQLEKLEKQPFDLNALAQEVVQQFEAQALQKNIKLKFESATGGEIFADRQKIRQVLVNLLANAVKFTEQGEIQVLCALEGDNAVLQVRDTGVGVPAEDLPFLFERFYRVEKARTRKTGGAGIGLAIAKAFVEAHGGAITAESTVGEGSVFTVILPHSTLT
ncbi:MAG: HAMP domain-containing histidine kinase [Oscillospiraceae bacterium]|jgi:signal transduction histidine kinase|nr:HAMP domain-containing histidine kinase [Oscillospiraceae bacterium]